MPSRNFCDRCDKQIPDGDEYFSVETERRTNEQYQRSGDLFIMRKWVSPTQHMYMVCKSCITEIIQVIIWHKKDDSGDGS